MHVDQLVGCGARSTQGAEQWCIGCVTGEGLRRASKLDQG